MTDKKISELTTLTGADAATGDLLPIVDISASETKKITREEFFLNIPTLPSVTITGGTINGTTIGGTTAAEITGTTITATGDVTIPDKIIHSGDTNTSIRFPADDTVTVETGGAERLRVTSTGNVGIGTTSPQALLSVSNAGAEGLEVSPGIAIGGVVRQIAFNRNTTAYIPMRHQASQIEFWGASTERMRIDSAGNVGIGTTSPATALDVNGQISGKFTDVGLNVAAQNLATNHVSQVTISAATTLTTTVPPAGSTATVIIVTSGTTGRTVTFGTGFASTGTLATGTTADRRFVVAFVSDGTRLLEVSRTTAITV